MKKLFIHTLTADDKYSLLNREKSMQLIQMDLTQKEQTFSNVF